MNEIKTLADSVVANVKDFVSRALIPVMARLDDFERQLTAIPAGPNGDAGKDGAPGERGADGVNGIDGKDGVAGERGIDGAAGKDGAPGERGADGVNGIDGKDGVAGEKGTDGANGRDGANGVDGKDGAPGLNGKDFDPAEMHAAVAKAVADIPPPLNGKDADEDAIVARVLASIPTPKDGAPGINGRDFDRDEMHAAIVKAVAEIPKPKDGESVHPDTVAVMVLAAVEKAVEKAVSNIELPQDGRDALDIDVVDTIEDGRSYAIGTFAKYCGGLVKALKHTEPIALGLEKSGWQVVTDGIADVEIEQDPSDPRIIFLGVTLTSGKQWHKHMRCPIVIDRGVFRAGTDYEHGDGATWDGSFWIAQKATQDKPGTSDAWRLAVKKGRDGKDAK